MVLSIIPETKHKDVSGKTRVLITLDRGIYTFLKEKGYKVSTLINGLLSVYVVAQRDLNVEVEGSTASLRSLRLGFKSLRGRSYNTPSFRQESIDLSTFYSWLEGRDVCSDWKRQVKASLVKILVKSIYSCEEFTQVILKNTDKINSSSSVAKAFKLLLNRLNEQGSLDLASFQQLSRKIKQKACKPDIFIPTEQQVKETLVALPDCYKPLYLAILTSGIRRSELDMLRSKDVRIQRVDGFTKVLLSSQRGKKSLFAAYLPSEVYDELAKSKATVTGMQSYLLKRKGLIRTKYLRKFFYATGVRLGVPEQAVDYMQGRSQHGVGNNHYLNAQVLADEWYPKIRARIEKVA